VLCHQFERSLQLVALGQRLSRIGDVLGKLLQRPAQSIGVRVIGQTTQRSLSAQLQRLISVKNKGAKKLPFSTGDTSTGLRVLDPMLELFFIRVVLEAIAQPDAQLGVAVLVFIRKFARRWT
jgi:hypothetical protein